MTWRSTIWAILVISLTCLQARADEPVRMRSDGSIIDGSGNIIAVPNVKDPRNTEYNKYYSKVRASGKPGTTSDFYVNADLNSGFVKKEINPGPAEAPDLEQADNTPVTNTAATSIKLYKYHDRPVYDDLQNSGAVYGN